MEGFFMLIKEDDNMARKQIEEQLKEKILIIDGAMGTMLQQANLTASDFGDEALEGCNEVLNITRPDVILQIHAAYLEAGSDIIETNTFGATSIVLAEYDLAHRVEEINRAAVRIACEARDKYSNENNPRYVAGSLGPTTKTLSVTGGLSFDELVRAYYEQVKALLMEDIDLLLLETSQDTLNVKAAGLGIKQAFQETNREVPLMISGTIEPMGTMLAGQNIEAFYLSIEHLQPIAVGLNCATGPEFMKDHIRTLSNLATCAISCYPNAGLPDEDGNYLETPESLAKKLSDFASAGWLNMVGGCCGTTPKHIQAIKEAVSTFPPRIKPQPHEQAVAGIEAVFLEEDNRPLLVGERTNVIGSRQFKRLIAEAKYEEASEVARRQVKGGAQIIDICLADPDRDELLDMEQFLQFVTKKVKAPLMIDSTDANVIEQALTYSQGKAIINSINLEDGEERFSEVIPLLHRFGAAVVVGTIDEEGMAVSRKQKLEIAKRSYTLLTEKYGVEPRDIIFDPLVFPVGTGDEQYIGSALETVEGIRLIKQHLPNCSTILGVSNVSFGLPPAGREVLNAVYLYECTKAGLDYAIVNSEKLERYASIPDEERKLAKQLLFETNELNYDEVLATFTAYYREKKVEKKKSDKKLPLNDRLANYVVEGSKDGLLMDLDEALINSAPLKIINGPLMTGMDEVGRLFNDNQLIVAEVLQSAEVMKAAVSHLEPHMEKIDITSKGKIMLATVKGDVHDIGKNLVEIILANNGYEIVNLGIKVPPEQLIAACRTEQPDAIGLSGLLVKSAQQMVTTAQDLQAVGITTPLLVGGAALSRKFTENRIAPAYDGPVLYAKDAMHGLELTNRLMSQEKRAILLDELETKKASLANQENRQAPNQLVRTPVKRSPINRKTKLFHPPDFDCHILRNFPITHLHPYVNQQMLLGRHLGVKGIVEQLLAERDPKATKLQAQLEAFWQMVIENQYISAHGMYQFYPAQASGDSILIYDPTNLSQVITRFDFPRQQVEPYLCLADFIRPIDSGEMDAVGFLSVTAGNGVRELAEQWKQSGDYLYSYMIQALALELAEAFAERIHRVMRDAWGFPDPVTLTMKERFGARYQGIRVSFGYPACPNLEDQTKLFELLQPEKIGIHLTEGFMMEPEASVSAMVFAHPQARYFNAV